MDTTDVTAIATIASEALALPDEARACRITDDASYRRVVEFAQRVKAIRKGIADTIDPHIRRAHEAHKALCEEKRKAESDAVLAERIVKDAIVAWEVTAERAREDERHRLETIARAAAGDVAIERALAAELDGDAGAAAAILDAPLHVPAAAVSSAPRPAGVALRETWSARVTNLAALIGFVAANPMYTALLVPNKKALDDQARSLRGRLRIDGVEAVCTKDAAIGGAR